MPNRNIAAAVLLAALLGACSSTSRNADLVTLPGIPPWADPAVCAAIVEPADDPATLTPADARFYLRADRLADTSLRRRDPLAAWAWRELGTLQWPAQWADAADSLKLTELELRERYFGTTLAIVEQMRVGRYAQVFISRADADDVRRLPRLLDLVPIQPGDIGPFAMYVTEGKEKERLVFAIGKEWFVVAAEEDHAHLRRALTAVAEHRIAPPESGDSAAPFADDPTHRALLAGVGAKATSTMFIRNASDTSRQAMAIVPAGDELAVHYTATSDSIKRISRQVDRSEGVDFGPLPASSVITAATINVMTPAAIGTSAQRTTSALAFPDSFENDIQPKLASPIIAFLGQLPADAVSPRARMTVPVFGLALKLKDHSVTERLDDMLRRGHSLVALSEFNVIKSLFGGPRKVQYGNVRYQVLDFGDALAGKVKDPLWKSLMQLPSTAGFRHLTSGRIGDWYVISSQEAFFRQCVAAHQDPTRAFGQAPVLADFALESKPQLLMSGLLRASEVSSLLTEARTYWKAVEEAAAKKAAMIAAAAPVASAPRVIAPASTPHPLIRRSHEFDQPLEWVAHVFKSRHSFAVQIWRESDDTVRGALRVIPDHPQVAQVPTPAPGHGPTSAAE